jgi:hypothetical protein
MSQFFTTRRDRWGRPYEAAIATIQGPTMPTNPNPAAARERVLGVIPDLIRQVDLHISKLESRIPYETSMQRGSAAKEIERFKRRRAFLAHEIITCGASDGLDIVWTQWTDPLINDARVAGMLATDETPTPSGPGPIQPVANAGLQVALKQVAEQVRRLEHQCRTQAVTSDRNHAADLLDKADICYYVACHLDNSNVVSNAQVDRHIDLTSILLPVYSAAQAEGRLITVDHNDNIRWVQEHREWAKTHRKWR